MKRIAILIVLLTLGFHSTLRAQEKEPLAMRIMLEWTGGGLIVGAGVGLLIWLTDPGRPNNKLSEQLALGAAWGSGAGAAVGLSRLNATAIPPVAARMGPGPLHSASRITHDPIADEDRRQDLLAGVGGAYQGGGGRSIFLPLLNLRF